MESNQNLTLRLTPEDCVELQTTVGDQTHALSLDREEFEQFFHHLLRLRAKLDLREARGAIDDSMRHGRF